ncbi:hypothetical protein Tco_0653350 [Tanacetum coccineum]|uniref:DUF4283 domain-containing protein n=1 Tax=Tanacetum coccineum TaxID=301880 RepID=A0ABQ4X052_9ASTR
MVLDNDGVASKTTKEKVKSLALKAKVTREQTSIDSDSQGGSDKDIDEEEAEVFNLLVRNFSKGDRFRRRYQFGNGGNRFGKGCGNSFGNKGGESSKKGSFDSDDGDEPLNNATCIMAIDSQEVLSKPSISSYDLNIIDLQKENEELLRFNKDFTKTFENLLNEKCSLESENSKLLSKINDLEFEVKKLVNDKEVTGLDGTINDDISLVDVAAAKELVSSSMVTTTTGNTPGKSLYANVTGKPSGKKLNFHTLFTLGGNGIDVVILVESICAISERFANTAYGFFLGKQVAYLVVAKYVRNTWGKYGIVRSMSSLPTKLFSFQFSCMKWYLDENLLKEDVSTIPVWVKLHGVPVTDFSEDGLSAIDTKLAMIKLRADVELKDNIVVAMPKITGEGHYTGNIHVEYEWKPPRCASCKVFGHIHEECLKNTGACETKTMKKPSQTSRGVPVGPKVGFKPHKEYRPVPKNPNANSSGNKKKDLVNNKANSNGSSFMNVDNSSTGTAPIIDKIGKFEDLLTSGQAILMDEAGNPLKKVEFSGD